MKKELADTGKNHTAISKNDEVFHASSQAKEQVSQGKRIFRRVPIVASVTLTFGNNGDRQSVPAIVSNISLSGIGIYSDHPITKSTSVKIDVNFISEGGVMRRDSMRGTVVHTNKIDALYYAGIEFDEVLSPAKQPSLLNHILLTEIRSYREHGAGPLNTERRKPS